MKRFNATQLFLKADQLAVAYNEVFGYFREVQFMAQFLQEIVDSGNADLHVNNQYANALVELSKFEGALQRIDSKRKLFLNIAFQKAQDNYNRSLAV